MNYQVPNTIVNATVPISKFSYNSVVDDSLIVSGIEFVFNSGESKYAPLKKAILASESITEYFSKLPEGRIDYSIMTFCESSKINLYEIPFWKQKIDSWSTLTQQNADQILNTSSPHRVIGISMIPEYDWKDIFESSFLKVADASAYSYASKNFSSIMRAYVKQKPAEFKNFIDSNIFGGGNLPGYQTRTSIYRVYVESGCLDKKTARKIRSDPSESSSTAAVETLLDNKDKYATNLDELILQFSDSKYETVINTLATKIPKHLLTSIVGTQFFYAKRIIDGRMCENDQE